MSAAHFLDEHGLGAFVSALASSRRVVAPVAKRGRYSFEEVSSAEELRLDYDVTILPPKKVFFPPAQPIVRFSEGEVSSCTCGIDTVLMGVHFYDVKAIDQLDYLMRENNADWDYLCQREATTIIASNIQTVSPRAFWDSVGAQVEPQGHDAFLTRIGAGYVYEPRTAKGEALLEHGPFRDATADEVAEARRVNDSVMGTCPERLAYSTEEIAARVRDAYGDEKLWDELAERCFSCGSCNTVCPTCYCFDVIDSWNLDQKSGTRTRYWDACLTREFAAVTGAGGSKENFREHHSSRFRHRFMRKTTYLNEKLGGPACVGCGRCSQACTADIADPVRVITTIMERTS